VSPFLSRLRGRIAKSNIPAFLLLAALNLSVCWRLFKVEFTTNFNSIEGSFIGLARYLSRHWGDFSWWPIWHCGMPYQETYVPLLHLTVAAATSLLHISAARAYHGVTGLIYALGPATLYLMAVRLGARRGAAFVAALFYSLSSPSALFMPGVARDIGGLWFSRRLQVLTVYGEGPHVSAMTLIPLVILALEGALTRRTPRSLVPAVVAIALVFLMNVPGTMALGLAVFCWICAQERTRLAPAWKIAAGASALAYGLACYGIPPSSLVTVGGNIGPMHRGFSASLAHGPVWLILAFAAVAACGYGLARLRVPLVLRFAILFLGLVAPLAITSNTEVFELLPQVGRLHLEAEMGACLLLGWLLYTVYSFVPRWIRPIVLVACLAPVMVQWQNYRERARRDIQYADLAARSEYTTARWLDGNMNGARVWAGGSTSFWLNSFTDTPQATGCCDQGLAMPVLAYVPYIVNSKRSAADTRNTGPWLQALGVHALVVNNAASTDEYKDVQAPERYAGLFPVLHEENGDTIYSILPASSTLAHVVREGEPVPVHGRDQKVQDAEALRYAAAVTDPARAPVDFAWVRGGAARLRAKLRAGDLMSVQVAWFPGWRAEVRGRRVPVVQDGLGFQLIRPECEGDCEIELRWTGRWDYLPAAAVSFGTLALLGTMVFKPRAIMNRKPT
jgi:hypothetical protein